MSKNYRQLWNDIIDANSETKAVRTLAEILADKEGRTFISHLGREDAKLCIEILDRGIGKHNLKVIEKQAFFITLRRLAGHHGRLPESMIITEDITVRDQILASGGYSDVRSGSYMGSLVAVKTLRVAVQDDILKIRKQFCKEVVLWSTLSHPNVLKLAGVKGDMDKGQFITISEWMTHGNIMEYIKKNSVNRLKLLHEAALGLNYLHGASLTHGDLKGANILMTNDTPPRACLADFGFMTMVLDPNHPMSCSAQLEGGTMTFMAPELVAPTKFGLKESTPTRQADIYAFGLVTFQVLTGEIPFRGFGSIGFAYSVVEGLRPDKPEKALAIGFSNLLWAFVQRCWDGNMDLRPKVPELVTHLERAAADWNGVMPPCVQVKYVTPDSGESMSDWMKHRGIFQPLPDAALEAPTDSQTTSGPFSHLSIPSTQYTEPPQEEPLEATTPKPLEEPQLEPWVPMPPRREEPNDDHAGVLYPHLNQNYKPPPSLLPQKRHTAFEYLKLKFRKLFRRSSPSRLSR